jgi:hypothetical protein
MKLQINAGPRFILSMVGPCSGPVSTGLFFKNYTGIPVADIEITL